MNSNLSIASNQRTMLRHLPNVVTVSRGLVGVALLCGAVPDARLLSLFAYAAISDGLDGFLARRFGWRSSLGGTLDLLADGMFFLSANIALWRNGLLPLIWLLLILLFALPQLFCQAGRLAKGLPIASAGLLIDKVLGAWSYCFVLALASGGDVVWFGTAQLLLQFIANAADVWVVLRNWPTKQRAPKLSQVGATGMLPAAEWVATEKK